MRIRTIKIALVGCVALASAWSASAGPVRSKAAPHIPAYSHIVVIMEENKNFGQIMDPAVAPNLTRLAKENGSADNFFGEVHPSEARVRTR